MSKWYKKKNPYRWEDKILRRKDTEWYQCAVANGWFDHTRDPSNPNFAYTLMSGGVLNVPIENAKQFLKLVAQDMDNGHVPDLNEISAPITRLYMDLDFKEESTEDNDVQLFSEQVITENECKFNGAGDGRGTKQFPAIVIEERELERTSYHNSVVVWQIAKAVAEYFPGVADKSSETFHVHAMWRPSRFKTKTNEYVNADGKHVRETVITHRSFGMHLVWPNLHVTHEEALTIRLGVIRALAAHFTRKGSPNNRTSPSVNSWEDIVDENVYLPVPSMRLIGSDKYQKCPECQQRGKKVDFVPFSCRCHGSRKVPSNSIYHYQVTYDGEGHDLTKIYKKHFAGSTFLLLAQCSIRDPNRPDLVRQRKMSSEDPVMVVPDNAPRYTGFKPDCKHGLLQSADEAKKYDEKTKKMVSGARTYARKTLEILSVDSKEFIAVQNIFNNAETVQANSKHRVDQFNFARYAGICVDRIRRGEVNGNMYYLIDVCDSGKTDSATYCHNAGRNHLCEKNVYFKISRKQGIVQRCCCWSQKTKRPVHCQKFSSIACKLPDAANNILFDVNLLQQKEKLKQETDLMIGLGLSASAIDKHRKDLERRFQLIEVSRDEEKLLQRYAEATAGVGVVESCNAATECADANGCGDCSKANESSCSTSSCATSPLDPRELARAIHYEQLRESDNVTVINMSEVEKTADDDQMHGQPSTVASSSTSVSTFAKPLKNFTADEVERVNDILNRVTTLGGKRGTSVTGSDASADPAEQYARYKRAKLAGKTLETNGETTALIADQKHRIQTLQMLYPQ